MDGDYDLDLVSDYQSRVSIITNNGDGTFTGGVEYAYSVEGSELKDASDLNGDGASELIFSNTSPSEVNLLVNNGDGTLGDIIRLPLPQPGYPTFVWSVSSGDCYGNGAKDLIAVGDYADEIDRLGYVCPIQNDTIQQLTRDCNGNGIPDECDIASGISQDVNVNGVPDECENDCNDNGIPDSYEISQGMVLDISRDGFPDECQYDVMIVPVAVMVDPTTTSEVRTELPDSIENVDPCTTFYLEIWASDIGDENTGLTGVYVDISFDDVLIAQAVEHGTIFTSFSGGTIETEGVDEFGGVSLPHGGGIEPDWVRVGWIEMELKSAVSRCTMELLPSVGGVGAYGRGPVMWEFVELGEVVFTRDCNNNGVPDDIDISEGTSEDCNNNEIPDECDIAEGRSEDCNGNGIPDECDIATGTSEDINSDGVPDECQLDVRIEPVVVLLDPSMTSEIRNTLPDSLEAVSRGNRYYIEIWASDVGEVNTGLKGVYVDVAFCGQTNATAVGHGTIFTSDPCGIIQTGKVDEFGGAADPCDVGIEPEWVRVGWIEMTAGVETANCTISLQPSEHGVEANNRGIIPWEVFVELGEVEVAITQPARSYDLYVDQFINVGDLSIFAVSWLQTVPPGDSAHDFNCDNYVGVGDLSWFATGWLKNTDDPTILYPPCPLGGDSMMFNSMGYTLTGAEDVAFGVVALNNPSVSDTTTLLPISIENISNGQTFYVEIWVIDVGDINTGITSAYVDLSFPAEAATVQNISHGGIFTEFAAGTTVTGGN